MAISYYSKARKIYAEHYPDAMLAIQPKSNWTGDVPLPGDLADFYATLGPIDIKLPYWPMKLTVPSLRKLWGLQAGYRYDAATMETYKDWPEHWMVVGRAGDDCVYVHDSERGTIRQAYRKRLRWKSKAAFETMGQYAVVTVALSVVVKGLGEDLTDGKGNMTEEACDRALLETFELMGRDIDKAEALLVKLGWMEPDDDDDE